MSDTTTVREYEPPIHVGFVVSCDYCEVQWDVLLDADGPNPYLPVSYCPGCGNEAEDRTHSKLEAGQ